MKPKVHVSFVDRSDVLKDTLWGENSFAKFTVIHGDIGVYKH